MARRIDEKKYDIWFITGSQHLYGEETLKKVAADSRAVSSVICDGRLLMQRGRIEGEEEIIARAREAVARLTA